MFRRAVLVSVIVHAMVLSGIGTLLPKKGESGVEAKKLQVLVPRSKAVLLRAAVRSDNEKVTTRLEDVRRVAPAITPQLSTAEPRSPAQTPTSSAIVLEPPPLASSALSYPKTHVASTESVGQSPGNELRDIQMDALRGYRIALAGGAKKNRLYPRWAEEQGIGGRVDVEVSLYPMSAPALSLKKTSGYEVLDHAALEMLRRAVGSVPLPATLSKVQHSFSLPVEFIPPP